jgi:hypothetical protein
MKSIVNNEFNLKVYENWEVWSLDSEWKHSSWVWVCKKIGRKLSFTPNWVWYLIANISLRREWSVKPRTLLLHRLVWCTFNGKSYDCEEKVTHIDWDCGNNCASNLRVKVNKVKAVRIREKSKAELDIDEYWECVRWGYKGKIICDANTKLPCSLSDWRLEKYGEGSPDDTFEIVGLRNGW